MKRIYEALTDGDAHPVNNGDTLTSLAATAGLPWEDIALANWGTDVSDEVNRALIEQIGVAQLNANAALTTLAGGKTVKIPRPFQRQGLQLNQTYTVRIRPRLPMPAVRITALSKWF